MASGCFASAEDAEAGRMLAQMQPLPNCSTWDFLIHQLRFADEESQVPRNGTISKPFVQQMFVMFPIMPDMNVYKRKSSV